MTPRRPPIRRTTRSSSLDLDGLAGLDDGARRRATPRAASSAVHEPRSDQPTSIERHHDLAVRAAPSMTA